MKTVTTRAIVLAVVGIIFYTWLPSEHKPIQAVEYADEPIFHPAVPRLFPEPEVEQQEDIAENKKPVPEEKSFAVVYKQDFWGQIHKITKLASKKDLGEFYSALANITNKAVLTEVLFKIVVLSSDVHSFREVFTALLSAGADVYHTDERGSNLVYYAIASDNLDTFKYVQTYFSEGDLYIPDEKGNIPLLSGLSSSRHMGYTDGSLFKYFLSLSKGVDFSQYHAYNWRGFSVAGYSDEQVSRLLSEHPEIAALKKHNQYFLVVMMDYSLDVWDKLNIRESEINRILYSHSGDTFMHTVAEHGRPDLYYWLAERGGNEYQSNIKGVIPVEILLANTK